MKSAFGSAIVLLTLVGTSGSVVASRTDQPASPAPPPASAAPAPTSPSGSPGPSASPSPVAAQSDSRVAARARQWLGRLQKADVDRSQLTADLSAGLEDSTVHALSKQLAPLGEPQNFALLQKHDANGVTTWVFRVSWPSKVLDYTFGLDDQSGRIAALYLRPGTA